MVDIDQETASELISSFEDHYETIQYSLNKLSHNTEDSDLINTVFRSIHTIKGNAAMAQVSPLVDYTHAIEETISSIRAEYFSPTAELCDLILTSIDRLKDLHLVYLEGKKSTIPEAEIISLFSAIANVRNPSEIQKYTAKLTQLFYPEKKQNEKVTSININSEVSIGQIADHNSYLSVTEKQQEDLLLFRILSLQVDDQNHFWHKRTDQLMYLAIRMTELSGKAIDKIQLAAAIYMHDVGMAFLSESVVNKNTKLNPLETKKLHQHPVWGYNLLVRMPPWRHAAQIILEHHEHIDGSGYPYQTAGDKLTEEAKIISILDAYYAMTNLRADRSHRRSMLRAISEINACIDTQFDEYWVEVFNQTIRIEVKAGNI